MDKNDAQTNYVDVPFIYCCGVLFSGLFFALTCLVAFAVEGSVPWVSLIVMSLVFGFISIIAAPLCSVPFLIFWIARHYLANRPYRPVAIGYPLLAGASLTALGFMFLRFSARHHDGAWIFPALFFIMTVASVEIIHRLGRR